MNRYEYAVLDMLEKAPVKFDIRVVKCERYGEKWWELRYLDNHTNAMGYNESVKLSNCKTRWVAWKRAYADVEYRLKESLRYLHEAFDRGPDTHEKQPGRAYPRKYKTVYRD